MKDAEYVIRDSDGSRFKWKYETDDFPEAIILMEKEGSKHIEGADENERSSLQSLFL